MNEHEGTKSLIALNNSIRGLSVTSNGYRMKHNVNYENLIIERGHLIFNSAIEEDFFIEFDFFLCMPRIIPHPRWQMSLASPFFF